MTAAIVLALMAGISIPRAAHASTEAPGREGSPTASQTAGGDPDATPRQLVAVFHVHTDASNGNLSPARLAAAARDAGIDVVLLSENFAYRFRYGPPLIRAFVEAAESTPTLEDHGIDSYLAEVRRVQEANPSPVLLVGVETPPYYYWTGGLLTGDLTLHDMQRNLLVFPPPGSSAPADPGSFPYRTADVVDFFEGLPTVGSPFHRHYGPGSLLLLVPGLVLAGAALRGLVRAGVFRPSSYASTYVLDEEHGRYVRRSRQPIGRHELLRAAVLFAGAALLWLNLPFSVATLDPYAADRGFAPFGTVIDYVAEREGLAFWSLPEGVDYHDLSYAGLRVRLSTHAHKEALLETNGYTGYGAVYADTTTASDAGDVWDQALLEYVRGERARPPWAMGESAFHFAGDPRKRLDDIYTVVIAPEPTHRAVFDAIANGRMYGTRVDGDSPDLRLTDFALSSLAGDRSVARSGDTLEIPSVEHELSLRVDEAGGLQLPIEITVVRNGRVHRRVEAVTPFEGAWLETLGEELPATYYRVTVHGPRPAQIVSNPIFVRDSPASDPSTDSSR